MVSLLVYLSFVIGPLHIFKLYVVPYLVGRFPLLQILAFHVHIFSSTSIYPLDYTLFSADIRDVVGYKRHDSVVDSGDLSAAAV